MDPREELALLEELDRLEKMDQMERLTGAAKATGAGVAEGVVGASVGLPGDVRNLVARTGAYDKLPLLLTPPKTPTTGEILQSVQGATGLPVGHQPQNAAERYLKAGASGITSFTMPPTGQLSLAVRAIAGLLSGTGGEVAASATGDLPGARPTGQTLAGILPLILGAKKPQITQAAQEGVRSLGEPADKLAQMRGRQQPGATAEEALARAASKASEVEGLTGARPTLAQTMDTPTFLSGLSKEVARSSSGQVLDRVLNRQTTRGHELIDEAIRRASAKAPSQDTANMILAAGDKAIERPDRVAKAISARSYRQAGEERLPGGYERAGTQQAVPSGLTGQYFVPSTTGKDLADQILARREELNLRLTDSGDAMAEAARMIRRISRSKEGIPVKELDAYRRGIQDKISRIESGVAVETGEVLKLQGYKAVSGLINDAIKAAGPALAEGKSRFALAARTAGEQMEKSAMPNLFTDSARKTGRGSYDEMTKLLSEADKYGPQDIRFAAENLRRADPEAFPALVRQHWESLINEARSPSSGRTSEQALNEWVANVSGAKPSQRRENFLETIRQLHTSPGRSPQETEAIVRGADAMADALLMFSRDRGGVGQLAGNEFRRSAGANVASAVGRSASFVPAWPMSTAFERVMARRVYRQVARALTEPNGAQILIDVASHSTPQRAAEGALRMLISMSAQNDETPE